MDAERYVSVGDGKVYLVQSDPMDTYEVSISDLIQLDVIPTISNVTAITFDGAQNYTLSYEEESDRSFCSSDCYYTEQKGKTVALDTDRVVSYYTTVNQLDLSDYVSYNVTEEELAAWGLEDPELSVTIDYTEADAEGEEEARTFCLHIGRNQEELAAKEEAEAAGEAYSGSVTAYVRVDGSSIVYAISESDYEALTAAAYNDLRHQKVLTADFASIRQMDITLDGNVYTITVASSDDASDDEELTYFYNGEEISISNIQSAWQNLSIQSFTEETPSAKKEIGFVLTMNDEKATTISVVLYRYNGTLCLAAVDGETVGFISRSAAVSLIEAIYALILG
jgi:hypothetical protein